MKKIFLSLLVIVVLAAALAACVGTPKDTVTAEQKANALFDDLSARKVLTVTGVVQKGDETREYSAVVDAERHAVRLTVDGETTAYYAKRTFRQKEDGYEIVSVDDTFDTFLTNLPYSAFFFTFDRDDCESADLTGSHLVVSFGGAGVKRCFSSSEDLSGGVFSIAFSGDKILSTVLTTELTVADTTQRLYARYTYSDGGEAKTDFDVLPSDGVPYAVYASEKLVAANGNKTLRYMGNDRQTTLDAILPLAQSEYITPSVVKNAFVIDSGEYVTLHLEYDDAKTVIGLSSSVREIDLTYRKADYVVNRIVVNEGLTYELL